MHGSLGDFLQRENPPCLAAKSTSQLPSLPSSLPLLRASISGTAAKETLLGFSVFPCHCLGLSRPLPAGRTGMPQPGPLPHHRAAISFALLFGIVPYLNLTPAKSHFGWLYQIRDGQQPSVELSPVIHRRIPAPIHYTMLIYSLLKPKHFRAGKENLEVFT